MKNSLELPAVRFEWEKFCLKNGVATTDIITERHTLQPDVTLVGWCEAGKLRVRPRLQEFAIMVEIEGEEVWCHVSPEQLKTILGQ